MAKVPYLTKGTSFLSYDDSHSVGEKTKCVRGQNLGGVIVWTAYGDRRAGTLSPATSKFAFSPTTDARPRQLAGVIRPVGAERPGNGPIVQYGNRRPDKCQPVW